MSAEKLRNALGQIQEDPDDAAAWADVERIIDGEASADVVRELEMGRVWHERMRNWPVVARLLTAEVELDNQPSIAGAKQLELARIFHEELLLDDEAAAAYARAQKLQPDEPKARQVLGEIEFGRANLDVTVEQALVESLDSDDDKVRVQMLLRAAEFTYRYGDGSDETIASVADFVRQALTIDDGNQRGLTLAALVYERQGQWERVADALMKKATTAPSKEDKIAAAYRLALVTRNKLDDERRAVDAHQVLLDLDPSNKVALQFLADHYAKNEEWDYLAGLYEDQLASGAVQPADELGVWVQLAMLNWKTRQKAAAAEPYFDKIRRVDPTHAGMLDFFRERCAETEPARLMSILTDAQRALADEGQKAKLAEEIASLAEGQENARRAIEQYKTILRSDPDNAEARDKLKALYLETESYNALVELLRQDLGRIADDDRQGKLALLREMAAIYRDKMSSETALLTVLTQILQVDDSDIDAVRDLVVVYEKLGRWRDLLNTQQKLANLTEDQSEKVRLLRAVARRWLDQFSNAQNAIVAYEQLLEATGSDVEAREKLRDLYKKRRSWDKLYELYESQLESLEPDKRVELMQRMAKLAAERLNKGSEAIRLLKEVLVFDPAAEGVLDTLERQAERQKDYHTVAHVLDRRIDHTEDVGEKLSLLQKLGVLYADKLDDAENAQKSWRRVLDMSPGHKRALRVLRQSFVDAKDWDGLSELYASQEDFEGLADFLSTTADRTKNPQEAVALSFRAAKVYEEQLETPERAVRSYERILGLDAGNVEAARRLLPLYEEDEKWSRLPGLLEILLQASDDVDEQISILQRMAEITGGPLANKTAALGYARKAYELRRDDEGLEQLRDWSEQSGEWSAFIEVVHERLKGEPTGPRARELKHMLAKVYANEVERIDEAVGMYRSLLEEDPSDEETARDFEELLRAADRRDDLRWLFELKVSQTSGQTRCEALEAWASVEEDVFGEPDKAAELFARVVEEDPTRTTSLAALTRLQLGAEDYAAAAATMQKHRDAVEGDERVELESELAQLYFEHLDDPAAAYEACVRALELDDAHRPVVSLLEKLMVVSDTRARAAEALERIYSRSGDAEKQVDALRALLETAAPGERRLELCRRLADVHESELRDPGGAFEVILNTLIEAPNDLTLWDRAAELGVAAGRPTDLAGAYRQHLTGDDGASTALSEDLQLELSERAAVLHEEQLGDSEGAVPYLERMLAIEPTHASAFERLKTILHALEQWNRLESLYQRTIAVTEDDSHKVELLHQAALVAEDMIGSDEKAIGYYERIMEIDPLHERASEALERLYGREERYQDLAKLLERRLETATDEESAPIQQQLVDLYLHRLEQYERVIPHLENVLRLREDDHDVRALAEECLGVAELRQPAAALLDNLYTSLDDPRDLVRVLDVRLEGAESEEQRRELLHRIAALRDERLKDDAGAFVALSALMPLEPEDTAIRRRLLDVGRRLGENQAMAQALLATAERATVPTTRGDILMEAAGLFRNRLDEVARAEEVYRQVLAIDPDEPELVIPAAKALAEIYQEESKHAQLAEVLGVQVRLVSDPDEAREIYSRIANIYEDLLENDDKAIEAWKARLELDTSDQHALRALERLYERTEAWRELVEVLRHLEASATDGDERKRCMVKAAEVLADELHETLDAINAWRAVLDDFGAEPDTLAALSRLYKKAERWEDLAEVYDSWLALSDEVDQRVELYAGLGEVRAEHLGDPQGALAAYREVLSLEPAHRASRAALEKLLEHDDADIKREAAEIIGPLYEADGAADNLLKVLDIEIEATYDPAAKLATLERALRTAEDTVGSQTRAFDYAARGVREAIGEPALSDWIAHAERLAAQTGQYEKLLELLERVASDILDADVQQRVRLRAGELARERMDDKQRAIGHYKRALEAIADDERAMVALEELYTETGDNEALLQILKMRADNAASDADRVALLFRVASLQAGPLGQRDDAIVTYEDLTNLSLEEAAVEALEELYGDAERFADLVALYERQLDATEGKDAIADIRVKIAKVAHAHLSDTGRALDELGDALGADHDHKPAIAVLEQLLETVEDPEQRGRIAEMLEPVYLSAHDWTKLQTALEARLETTQDPNDRGELLTRLATLYEEQLENYDKALDTVALRLRDEPGDEDIWSEVERLGRVLGEGSEARVARIFASALEEVGADDPKTASLSARTGELFAAVGENEEALRWYRRAYEFSPDSQELFEAMDKLLVKLDRPGERIEHYRGALDNTFDDEVRVRHLHTVASLHRGLGQDEDAMTTLIELLDIDERNEQALEALTQLYLANDRLEDLADLYERRSELADAPEVAAPHRLSLAQLLSKSDDTRDRALDQLDLIVGDLPWHEGAIAELEKMLADEERKQRVIDILRPLYERAQNWEGLIHLDEQRLALSEDPQDRVEVLMNTAQLWEEQGGQQDKAFEVVREAFELVPENEETREHLERLAGQLDAWGQLADSYAGAAARVSDDYVRRQLYDALATICDERLDDPRRALMALGKLSELDPADEEPLERMDLLCTLLADWPTLVTVIARKAENATGDDERAELLLRLGELKHDMLGDPEGAIEAYEQAVELSPESTLALDSLIALYETRDAERLAELLEQRIQVTDATDAGDERHALVLRLSDVYKDRLDKPDDAIRALQLALDERPTDQEVLSKLEVLFRQQELYGELLENLKTQASIAEDVERRLELRNKIGDLYIERFDNAFDALEQYRAVLEEDEDNGHAIDAVRAIGDKYEDQRIEVAELLVPVLRNAARHQDLVDVEELRFSALTDPADRAKTLVGIALIQEEQLDQPARARDTLLRALAETPEESVIHDDVSRLCELTGDYSSYADVLSERADATYDAVVQTDLYSRLGRIAEEELGDKPRAIAAYGKAAEQAEDPAPLYEALDRLYLESEQWRELARVLERRIELTADGAEQADLNYRLGTLQIERFDEQEAGLSTLRVAADLNPEHEGVRAALEKLTDVEALFEEVAEALDTMYRVAQDSAARAKLRNKRISYAPTAADRVRLRLELAQMLEDESFDTSSAQDVIQQAFYDDPSDPELLAQLERLATTNANGAEGDKAWRRAADAVGEAVEKALQAEIEGVGEGNMTAELARDLHLRTAGWYKDHVGDRDAAEARLGLALRQDERYAPTVLALEELHRVPGREKDLVGTLRKLAELAQAGEDVGREPSELRREAKVLAEDPLGDMDLAEAIIREMLEADDADVWALTELCAACERKQAHDELFKLLRRRIELMPEPDQLRELRHQAASVAADALGDKEAAVDLYEQAFEEDPRDEVAAKALRGLYESLESYEPLLRFTERLLDLADTPEERADLRLEAARICIDVLETPSEGIDHLNAVLDELPSHEGAVELLSKILEKEQRDDELAELLNSQIELAREAGDQRKELGYRVKAAELYETRLNDPDKAIDGYLGVLETDAGFRPALEALARLYRQQDQPGKSAEMYEKLLDGGDADSRTKHALQARDLYVAVGDKEAACRVLETVLGGDVEVSADDRSQLRNGLRSLYRERSAWDKLAELITTEANEASDDEEKVVLLRKAIEIHAKERGDHAAAAELLEQCLKIKPDDRELMLSLCDEYTASGRGKEAIEVLQRVVESYGGRRSKELADIHQRIASAYLAEGDNEAALGELESARKMDPGSVKILYELGSLSLRLADAGAGDKEEHTKRAGNAFRSLLLQRLDADSPVTKADVFYQLALVSNAEGDKKKAKQMAERALANDKSHELAKALVAELG